MNTLTRLSKKSVAVQTADGEATPSQVIVVQNWFEELRRLVPTD